MKEPFLIYRRTYLLLEPFGSEVPIKGLSSRMPKGAKLNGCEIDEVCELLFAYLLI